jgi:hemolysin activation/secretion protein
MRRGWAALLLLPAAAAGQPVPQPGLVERIAPAPAPTLSPPALPPEPTRRVGLGESRRIALGTVRIEGAAALQDAELRPLVAPLAGREAALGEIEAARLAVLHAYRAAGFPYVAVAALLAPGAEGAALTFRVTEGFVSALEIEGGIGPAEAQARRFLAPLVGQRPLSHAALERALLLASDIPGVAARGVLRSAGDEPGALRLVVRLARQPVTGFLSLDNRGNPLTGAWQGLLSLGANAFTSVGERTEVALVGTDGAGQGFAQLSGEAFLGGSGLRLRGWAGAGRAAPGSPLAAIGYAGETRVTGAALAWPLLRSRPLNLTLSAGLDAFESTVEARDAPGLPRRRQSRDAVRAVRLGAEFAALDGLAGAAPAAASTALALRLHRGLEAFGASDGSLGAAARLGSDFGFAKVTAEATRLQPLLVPAEGWMLAAQAAIAGQWSDDVLPPAEKFYLGGNRLGRGYHAGQLAGDRALALSGELQLGRMLDLPAMRLGTQLYLFRDEGWAADKGPGGGTRHLASWGGGVRLQFAERAQLDLEAVRRLARQPEGAGVTRLVEDAVFVRLLLRH